MKDLLKQPIFLQSILHGIFDEAYVIDAVSMHLIAVSESVYANSGLTLEELKLKPLEELLEMSTEALLHQMQLESNQIYSDQAFSPADILYQKETQLKILHVHTEVRNYLLVIKNDASSKEAIAKALRESELRFQAIVTNTPGLVCQFQLDSEGDLQFIYLSDRCHELLGFTADQLKLNSKLFYEMMNPRDRTLFKMRLKYSRTELSMLNWDGRVWIDDWQDTKWINMRSVPRILSDGVVQWEGFITNITQTMQEKFEMEESRRRLAELTMHMNDIKEEERHKIACEIHDDLGGNLTAIKIGLSSIMQRVSNGQEVTMEKLSQLDAIVDSTYDAIHRISSDLRPNILNLGIVAALEWQSREFEKQYNIPCIFSVSEPDIPVQPDQAMAMFRICQEAMSNIAKYAQATEVNVSLNKLATEVEMVVSDNGIGIKPADKMKDNSFGLRGMQERVSALNGHFKISRLRGDKQGTSVNVKLPMQVA